MAKDEKKTNQITFWELVKTGTMCTMFGAMTGGFVTYHAENSESNRHLRVLENQVYRAEAGFGPTRDSLNKKIFHYKFHKDSLQNLLWHTQDSLKAYISWYERNKPTLDKYEGSLQDCRNDFSSLESQLDSVLDSLNECRRVNNKDQEDLEHSLRQTEKCEDERSSLSNVLDSVEHSLQNEQREVEIRDNQIDSIETILNKHKYRYVMETEFAMLTVCIYGHGNRMTKSQYERQQKCCIDYIRSIQKKYPTDSELEKIQDDFEVKNTCNTPNYYEYDD